MRARAPLAVAAFLAAFASLSFAAFEPKGMWDGCGQGSWVQAKTTSKTVMEGMQIPDSVSESRQTLVKATDAEWVVKTESKTGEEWGNATEISIPRVAPKGMPEAKDMPKAEDLGTEKVTVEGKEYACKKQKVTFGGETSISWTSEEHGMLKSESSSAEGGSSTSEVTALAKKVKVAGKEVACRETKTVSKVAGSDVTMVTLASDDVPGRVVRMETAMAGPVKSTTVTEVVAFEVK